MLYKTLSALSLLLLTTVAQSSENSRFSIGGNYASTKFSSNKDLSFIEDSSLNIDEDLSITEDTNNTYGLYAQYDWNTHFGIQLQHTEFGEYNLPFVKNILKVDTLSIVGRLNNYIGFTPYGKLGYGRMNMKQEINVLGFKLDTESTGDAFLGAIGLEYFIPDFPSLSVKLEMENFVFYTASNVQPLITNKLNSINLGLALNF